MLLYRLPRLQLQLSLLTVRWAQAVQLRSYAIDNDVGRHGAAGRAKTNVNDIERKNLNGNPTQQTSKPAYTEPAPKASLFEELFPEETKPNARIQPGDADMNPLPLDPKFVWAKPPLNQQRPNPHKRLDSSEHVASSNTLRRLKSRERENATVLVLSNAGKSLVESDFMRISPKGEHIEGWNSGIIQGNLEHLYWAK